MTKEIDCITHNSVISISNYTQIIIPAVLLAVAWFVIMTLVLKIVEHRYSIEYSKRTEDEQYENLG